MGVLRPANATSGAGVAPASGAATVWPRRVRAVASIAFIVATLFACGYLNIENARSCGVGAATSLDLAAGALAILLVLELARRTTGWGITVVALLALVYAAAGPYLPGILAHRGYSARRVIEHLYLTSEGIWGIPLGVSADFVYLFIARPVAATK